MRKSPKEILKIYKTSVFVKCGIVSDQLSPGPGIARLLGRGGCKPRIETTKEDPVNKVIVNNFHKRPNTLFQGRQKRNKEVNHKILCVGSPEIIINRHIKGIQTSAMI